MNLIIDVGNTLVKFAVFQEDMLVEKSTVKNNEMHKAFDYFLNKYNSIQKGIISSVGHLETSVFDSISKKISLHILDSKTKLPFKNSYKTPHTLGVDRVALVSASVKQYPNSNVLIIDAGTCITYDFITSANEYLGGSISPGIRLRYTALNTLTAKLPLLETKMPKNRIGNTTADAIHSGVVFGILYEIEGIIGGYQEDYEHLTVILTGGDADFLSKQFKNSIFANSNFLLEGLNFILEFNKN